MKSRANAFQSVEDLRSKFTAEPGYSAFEVSEWRGRVSTCLDTRNTRGGDRSEEFHRGTRIFSKGNVGGGGRGGCRASLIILIHLLFPKFFTESGHSKSWTNGCSNR